MKKVSYYINLIMKNAWGIITAISCFCFPAMILFIPVTIYEINHNTKRNKVIFYCAIASFMYSSFMVGSFLVISFAGELGSQIYSLMFTGGFAVSIYLLCVYIPLSKRAKIFEKYLLLIQDEHITSISEISEITGFSNKKVISSLRKLIKMGELDGASIDENDDEIIFKKSVWASQRVICKNCSAELVVNLGHTLVCEYCKGALEIERKK